MTGKWPTCTTVETGPGRMVHHTKYNDQWIYLSVQQWHPINEMRFSWELMYDGFMQASMVTVNYAQITGSLLTDYYPEFERVLWGTIMAVRPAKFDSGAELIKYLFPTVWMEALL